MTLPVRLPVRRLAGGDRATPTLREDRRSDPLHLGQEQPGERDVLELAQIGSSSSAAQARSRAQPSASASRPARSTPVPHRRHRPHVGEKSPM